jgi:fatty acid desaturase
MDDELGIQTADEVLEAAWPKERRRARRQMALAHFGRTAVFLAMLGGLSFAVYLLFGMVIPWTFFVFMGALALVGARPEADERALLHRTRPASGSDPNLR